MDGQINVVWKYREDETITFSQAECGWMVIFPNKLTMARYVTKMLDRSSALVVYKGIRASRTRGRLIFSSVGGSLLGIPHKKEQLDDEQPAVPVTTEVEQASLESRLRTLSRKPERTKLEPAII